MMTQFLSTDEIIVREAVPSSDTVRERFAVVDGLRAVAIIAVLIYEAFVLVPGIANGNANLARALGATSQGVTLFLLLSGFTLAYPAIVAYTEHGQAYLDVARYLVKRALRIYPAYLLALVLAIAIPPVALRYGLPAFAGSAHPANLSALVPNLLFSGNGLGNDGFRALGSIARCYLAFPLLLLLWVRSGRIFAGVLAALAILDATTGLHALGIGALVPFMLGMMAASVRAQNLPAYRFGLPLALAMGYVAFVWSPALAHAAAAHAAAGTPWIDPLWSVALFGVLVASTAIEPLERISAFAPLRLFGAASFAISLVVAPVSSFAVRQLLPKIGPLGAFANAVAASIVVGFVLWQLIDRGFGDGPIRREAADRVAPMLANLLSRVRANRVVLGGPAAPVEPDAEPQSRALEPSFYAPPPRPDASGLAIVSQRSGTPDDLAAEILATKKRLAERSAAIFADPKPVEPQAAYQKPGFYRKSSAPPSEPAKPTVTPLAAVPVAQSEPSVVLEPHLLAVAPSVPMFNTLPLADTHDVDREAHEMINVGPAMPSKTPASGERSPIKMRIGGTRPNRPEPPLDGELIDA